MISPQMLHDQLTVALELVKTLKVRTEIDIDYQIYQFIEERIEVCLDELFEADKAKPQVTEEMLRICEMSTIMHLAYQIGVAGAVVLSQDEDSALLVEYVDGGFRVYYDNGDGCEILESIEPETAAKEIIGQWTEIAIKTCRIKPMGTDTAQLWLAEIKEE